MFRILTIIFSTVLGALIISVVVPILGALTKLALAIIGGTLKIICRYITTPYKTKH